MAQANYGHTSRVFLIGPDDRIVLVLDPNKPDPKYANIPGGGAEDAETPAETAVRELEEETGLILDTHELTQIHQETHTEGHVRYVFMGQTSSFANLKTYGDEGEKVETCLLEDLLAEETNLLPCIKKILGDYFETVKKETVV